MLVYYFSFFLILCFSSLEVLQLKEKRKIFQIVSFITFIYFWIILSIRWNCLNDWSGYYKYYVHDRLFSLSTEIGFKLVIDGFKQITRNYTIFLFFINFIILLFFYKSIMKLSNSLIVFLFFFTNYFFIFGGLRQVIALSIIAFSIPELVRKDGWRFFLFVTIAGLFHYSAFVFYFSYFLVHKRYSTTFLLFIVAITVLVNYSGLLRNLIIGTLTSIFKSGAIAEKVLLYQESVEQINIFTYIKRLLFPLLYLFLRKYLEHKSDNYNVYLNLMFLSTIIFFLFVGTLDWISTRGSIYFGLGELFIFPIILESLKKDKYQRVLGFSFIVLLSLIKLYIAINQPGDFVYKTFLNKNG